MTPDDAPLFGQRDSGVERVRRVPRNRIKLLSRRLDAGGFSNTLCRAPAPDRRRSRVRPDRARLTASAFAPANCCAMLTASTASPIDAIEARAARSSTSDATPRTAAQRPPASRAAHGCRRPGSAACSTLRAFGLRSATPALRSCISLMMVAAVSSTERRVTSITGQPYLRAELAANGRSPPRCGRGRRRSSRLRSASSMHPVAADLGDAVGAGDQADDERRMRLGQRLRQRHATAPAADWPSCSRAAPDRCWSAFSTCARCRAG